MAENFDRDRGFVRPDDIPREEDESTYEKAVQKLTRRFDDLDSRDDEDDRSLLREQEEDRSREDDDSEDREEEETIVFSRSDAVNRMITDDVRERTNQLREREDEEPAYIERIHTRDENGNPLSGTRYSVVNGVVMAYDYSFSKDRIDAHDEFRLARDDEMAQLQREQEAERQRDKEYSRSMLSTARDDE